MKRFDFLKEKSYNKTFYVFFTENITQRFKEKAKKKIPKKSSELSPQGSEGAFCENCFLAKNLPTCFACKAEIAGAGDDGDESYGDCQICTF